MFRVVPLNGCGMADDRRPMTELLGFFGHRSLAIGHAGVKGPENRKSDKRFGSEAGPIEGVVAWPGVSPSGPFRVVLGDDPEQQLSLEDLRRGIDRTTIMDASAGGGGDLVGIERLVQPR